jgi:hypothetical protein
VVVPVAIISTFHLSELYSSMEVRSTGRESAFLLRIAS